MHDYVIFSALPAGWIQYPGTTIDGSHVIFQTETDSADLCLSLCTSNTDCSAVSFDAYGGGCAFVKGRTDCKTLLPKSGSYYMSKSECVP